MTPARSSSRRRSLLLVGVVMVCSMTGCTTVAGAVPECHAGPRLALVAQSVPGAAYVPCIRDLPEEWSTRSFHAGRRGAGFTVVPHGPGSRPVRVRFDADCDVAGAVPTTPRAEGVRTSIRLVAISPRYTGILTDAFAGGCVTYRFDFARGPHIGLMEELGTAVGLFSRRELSLDLHHQLGVDLDPSAPTSVCLPRSPTPEFASPSGSPAWPAPPSACAATASAGGRPRCSGR